MLGEEGVVASSPLDFGGDPGGSAFGEFFVGDVPVQRSVGDVEFNFVAGLNLRERAAEMRFWRDVKDAGSMTSGERLPRIPHIPPV